MAYADLNTIHNPATGTVAPASWGDQVRDNLEFLVDPPTCSVSHSTTQTIATATVTTMSADTEAFDNDSMHSIATNTSRITIQTAGRYFIYGTVLFSQNGAASFRRVSILHNGTTSYGGMQIVGSTTVDMRIQATRSLVLAAGDYVECTVRQDSGANVTAQLDEFFAMFLTR